MARSVRRKLRQIERARVRTVEERTQQILDERTERLAARRDAADAQTEAFHRVLLCGAGRELFGLPIDAVAEVLPPQNCMPAPDGPPALFGLFGRSGRLVSVIDLGLALGLEQASPDHENHHFVLLRREHPHVALRVERAHAVADVLPLRGEEAASFRNDAVTGYGKVRSGDADREETLSLLDLEGLLRPFLPTASVPGV
ncbi:chemotaxis protein CheW [Microvirga sesbaniae]|uniref:chemotaxis protein CheW n=1 Tax=Microvirga sesbaniae TaxID=681392 RepID=UPI0021C5A5E0|nr:chemotaxis protein CheW [Microvirga sp. HBU67692]